MKQELEQAVGAACNDLFGVDVAVELTRPDAQFGDYATNVALQLAKQLGKNPRDVAESIAEHVRGSTSHIQDVTIAGPGFLNLKLTDEALSTLANILQNNRYAGQKIVIETNNPNPFKDIHIGHAFNSIVADTVANLLEAGGGDVRRVSYHGDVGLHVGKSLWAIFDEFREAHVLDELQKIPSQTTTEKLRLWYAKGATAYDQNSDAKLVIEQYATQSFRPEGTVKVVYDTCKQWSFSYFDQVFGRIGSKPTERRYLESETDVAGRKVVEENTGTVFERSDKAIIFPAEKYDQSLHTRVFISSAGNTLYEARDLGLMQLKATEYEPDLSYIVTAVEQKEYFRVVLKAAEMAMPNLKTKTVNIPTGTVKLTTGKMSSRTGDVVTIEWLFDQLEKAVRAVSDDESTIHDSVIAALRYTMLKGRLDSDTIFDIEESVSLQGNTGPYLQYAHARARSVLAKLSVEHHSTNNAGLEVDERNLLRKIGEYNEVVDRAVQECMPHIICTYLYELAQEFNRFYEKNHVVGDTREAVRAGLVARYADTLKHGLGLLNIPAPERM